MPERLAICATRNQHEIVAGLVLLGTNREKIAAIMGITQPTLEKYFGDTLDRYQSRMLSKVAGKAYSMALDEREPAQRAEHDICEARDRN